MNLIDIILLVGLLAIIGIGVYRGVILSALQLAAYIISAVFSKLLSPVAASLVYNNYFKQRIIDGLNEKLSDYTAIEDIKIGIQNVFSSIPSSLIQIAKQFGIDTDAVMQLPEGIDTSPQYLEAYVFRNILITALTVVSAIIIFAVFSVFLRLICHFINKRLTDRLEHPVINSVNRLAGGAVGIVKGGIAVSVIAIVLNLIASAMQSGNFYDSVCSSKICSFAASLFT